MSNECVGYLCGLSIDPSTLFADCIDGDIRLAGGSSDLEGRVEICVNNAWGTVCSNAFSENDAVVVCSQLGYPFEGTTLPALE